MGLLQAIELQQTTEIPDSVYIGTPFYIHLVIPAGVDSIYVIVPDSLPNFQIIDQKRSVEKDKKEFVIKAAAFETGNLQFPQLKIKVYKKASQDSASISPFNLTVRSVLPPKGEPKLKDIAPPLNIPWTVWNYLLLLITAAIVVGIIYLLRHYLKKSKENVTNISKPIDSRSPWVIALEELEVLQALRLLDKGDYLDYHFSLSMIMRRFLELFAGFNAVEMTTSEIRDILHDLNFQRNVGIIEFLQDCDKVKFAKHIPSRDESDKAYRWLYMYLTSFNQVGREQESNHA